ncbi:MAG TPA: nitroreductase family protein [Anaerolineaceae bacterium]|nr:nitroreductase family protein [Anaerolineaceae bacterium]
MDAIETILTRRSIRSFTAQPVARADLETLLRAAMAAPSAGTARPWHFVVITDRTRLDAIAAEHSSAHMLLEAPLAILVCADLTQTRPDRWMQDCSAATQNLLLAAHALGLGAVWIGVQPVAERIALAKRTAALPEPIEPVAIVAVGYPNETPEAADRFMPERIHFETW